MGIQLLLLLSPLGSLGLSVAKRPAKKEIEPEEKIALSFLPKNLLLGGGLGESAMADVAVAVDVWVHKDVVAAEEAVAGPSGGKNPKMPLPLLI